MSVGLSGRRELIGLSVRQDALVRKRRPATEEEVVLAFLRAEVDSPRFGEVTRAALEPNGGMRLVMQPDLESPEHNAARFQALAETKGWGTNSGLFAGFPVDVTWCHGVLDTDEVNRVRFIHYSYWVQLSGGSRRPADVGATLASGALPRWVRALGTDRYFELAAAIRAAGRLGPLIVVSSPGFEKLVVLEGHARLTAFHLAGLVGEIEVTAYVGTSPAIDGWALF